MKKFLFIILLVCFASGAFAQTMRSHTVQAGETVYSLSRANGITEEQFLEANPSVKSGLRSGQIIQIPITKQGAVESTVRFTNYKVKRKDTLYSIAKRYGVSVDDIIKYNPWSEKGIKKKDILRIPNKEDVVRQYNPAAQKQIEERQPKKQTHEVKAGETLYSLSKQYNRSIDAIVAENPEVIEGLKVGMVLSFTSIYTDVNQTETIAPQLPSTGITYQVRSGDTVYKITNEFNISVGDLYAANPGLENTGLRALQVLKIPVNTDVDQQWIYQPAECQDTLSAHMQSYEVALLLPFSANANNLSDQIDPTSKGFLQMYQGVLLAMDKMRKQGMNVSLTVFDTQGKLAKVNTIIQDERFKKANLIIGPVYPNVQTAVANYAAMAQVPMVSPLSSSGTIEGSNPYYFKVNPADAVLVRKTRDYVQASFSQDNFIIAKPDAYEKYDEAVVANAAKSFKNYHEYAVASNKLSNLRQLMVSGEESNMRNVAFVPSSLESEVSSGVSSLYAVSDKYPVTLIGMDSYIKYNSIQTTYFHKMNMHYLSPYFINYDTPKVSSFVDTYREEYSLEPTQFSFQGYDVAYYFMSAMYTYGSQFVNCIADFQEPDLLQGKYQFVKQSENGGWMNEGLYVIEYKPDFSVDAK